MKLLPIISLFPVVLFNAVAPSPMAGQSVIATVPIGADLTAIPRYCSNPATNKTLRPSLDTGSNAVIVIGATNFAHRHRPGPRTAVFACNPSRVDQTTNKI